MYRHVRVLTRTGIAVATAGALALTTAPGATAADLSYSASTSVGVHNSYDKAKYTYFADALDSGAGMLNCAPSPATATSPAASPTSRPGTTRTRATGRSS